ncbi:MAG TPA: 1-acyl-sn-glycerol-3-phosphate acyltransferase [Vicinamibacteria bacterium]|nr:1-acyl-sn-glycerol-3-phosphate acyltransferase [Vicinamibacteria bacterium]
MTVLQRAAGWLLRRAGWTISGARPTVARYVLVASPHSSNWDTAVMLLFAVHFGIRLRWIGKRESFRWPLGPLLRRLGGIPIDRGGGQGLVAATAEVFRGRAHLALAIAPDGTRRGLDYWRSGFYHIAQAAGVPLVLAFLDWGTRRAGIGPTMALTGNVVADMDGIRAFYAGMVARYPEQTSRVRLREEDGLE